MSTEPKTETDVPPANSPKPTTNTPTFNIQIYTSKVAKEINTNMIQSKKNNKNEDVLIRKNGTQ